MIRSIFFYGYEITADNSKFYFNEGSGTISFDIPPRSYSLETLRSELLTLLNSNGDNTYSVTVNRSTRRFTISADATFDLLPSESTENAFSVLGFTSDKTGLLTYESDETTGSVYKPQFPLERYVPFEDNVQQIKGAVAEAPSGFTQSTSFGFNKFMECDFKFIGDITQKGLPVEQNPNGRQDARDFLDYCITKGDLEFMYDRDDLDTFHVCVLERVSGDSKGLGYKLRPIQQSTKYFEMRGLVFRELN